MRLAILSGLAESSLAFIPLCDRDCAAARAETELLSQCRRDRGGYAGERAELAASARHDRRDRSEADGRARTRSRSTA